MKDKVGTFLFLNNLCSLKDVSHTLNCLDTLLFISMKLDDYLDF